MSIRSPSGTSVPTTGCDDLGTGVLSPVRPASSISSVAATRTRPSAGTLSPGLEADDVPGDQLLGWNLDALAVATDVGGHDQHLAERGDALGGLALLVQAHHRVEHRQPEDDQAGRDLLQGDDADHRRTEQHELHQVSVLAQERPSRPAPWPPRPACSARTLPPLAPPRLALRPTAGSTSSCRQTSSAGRPKPVGQPLGGRGGRCRRHPERMLSRLLSGRAKADMAVRAGSDGALAVMPHSPVSATRPTQDGPWV